MIGCVPRPNVDVWSVAWPPETDPLPIGTPPSANWTVPDSPEADELIVAVKVTVWPTTEGLAVLARPTVVVAWVTLSAADVAEELVLNVESPL